MKQTHSKTGAHRSTADDDRLEKDWPDEDWEDSEPEYDVECGLPLGGENLVTGEPLVTVDYFDFAPAHKAAIADGLLTLEGAVLDDGAATPRILVFDTLGGHVPRRAYGGDASLLYQHCHVLFRWSAGAVNQTPGFHK